MEPGVCRVRGPWPLLLDHPLGTNTLEDPAKWLEPASKAHTNLSPMSIVFLALRETKWKLCWGRRGQGGGFKGGAVRIYGRRGWVRGRRPKGLSRVFSNTVVQKHQFVGAQLSL